MKNSVLTALILSALVIGMGASAFAGPPPVNPCQALEAGINKVNALASPTLIDLASLLPLIKQNPKCDDGYYAEGISDIVLKISNKVSDEGALLKLIAGHSGEVVTN